jgi:hypothetical protein
VVLIPNRHWGGEGLLGCIFGFAAIFSVTVSHRLTSLVISFGLLHRIPAQPHDRAPGTLPAELQEQGDEYDNQHLFVPADVEVDGTRHSSSQLAEWRQQEQDQWNREVLARSSHTQLTQIASEGAVHDHHHTPHSPLPRSYGSSQNINSSSNGTQNSNRLLSTTDSSTPTRTRSPLGNSMNGDSSTQS